MGTLDRLQSLRSRSSLTFKIYFDMSWPCSFLRVLGCVLLGWVVLVALLQCFLMVIVLVWMVLSAWWQALWGPGLVLESSDVVNVFAVESDSWPWVLALALVMSFSAVMKILVMRVSVVGERIPLLGEKC